ncbi:MAG TPA: LuxR C-terminal-related transcriptional regulator, partial [Actinomycetales bacterium]|nr:LuxR C-terminal-related transcriptional regulator [Actinomycetales bacterium]
PAGFGKSTALAAWLAGAEKRSAAWLSLEESDRHPSAFLTYLISAVRTVAGDLGGEALSLLQSAQVTAEAVLASLINDLSAMPNDLYVVLDDYHLVDGPEVATGMTFLLEHLPQHVHVVLSTRVDPDLPLPRLRARGELVEIRAADLRFTREETAGYLNGAVGLDLSPQNVAVLEERTEGWVAALQLAALSMQGRDNLERFIENFAGDDRYIVDYLVDEVLERQPTELRSFLVQTSILDRLTGPLCDAVTGQVGGRSTLETLERTNLFVVPLDDSRRWYRYHHLFADVLRTHLHDERPDLVAELHRRASHWYEQAGEADPAVRHALASGDMDRAAELIEVSIPGLQRDRQESVIRAWLDLVPDEVVRARPVLAVGFTGALMAIGEFDSVAGRLRDVEHRLRLSTAAKHAEGDVRPEDIVVADEKQLARLPGAIELYWAGLSLVAGDPSSTHRHAQQAIDRAAPSDHLTRAAASGLSGLAHWAAGDLDEAHAAYSTCVEGLRRAGHVSDVLGCTITLADIRITQGRLGEALASYEQALQLASRERVAVRGTADMHVGMGQIAMECGDLATAGEHLRRAQELGDHLGLPQNPYRWRLGMARIREAQDDLAGAFDLLREAERVYTTDFSPHVRPIPAVRARMLAAHGDVDAALDWARRSGVRVDDELSYLREYEHITLARVLLAQHATTGDDRIPRQAIDLLTRLLSAAEAGGRSGSVIEISVLEAVARHAVGDNSAALDALERAVELAEPEGYVHVFAGEGRAMAELLRRIPQAANDYGRQLVDACAARSRPAPPAGHHLSASSGQRLVDPLSERELQVLRLLSTDLDGPELARHLVVSLNTLRTHTKNIYAKLGVNSRRAAVRRAAELDLLSAGPDG